MFFISVSNRSEGRKESRKDICLSQHYPHNDGIACKGTHCVKTRRQFPFPGNTKHKICVKNKFMLSPFLLVPKLLTCRYDCELYVTFRTPFTTRECYSCPVALGHRHEKQNAWNVKLTRVTKDT